MKKIETHSMEEFVQVATKMISTCLRTALKEKKQITVGLSGGSTPIPIYTALGKDASIAWERVTLFLVDERYIPSDHVRSNQRMIRSSIASNEGAKAVLLAPDTSESIMKCVTTYAKDIAALPQADIIILGMGDDGHIASLFPPLPPEAFKENAVIHTMTDRFPNRSRISVTLPVLCSATERIMLIAGQEKKALLEELEQQKEEEKILPAAYCMDEHTTWILGKDAEKKERRNRFK